MTTKDWKPYFHVAHPKLMYGDEVVREVAVPPMHVFQKKAQFFFDFIRINFQYKLKILLYKERFKVGCCLKFCKSNTQG